MIRVYSYFCTRSDINDGRAHDGTTFIWDGVIDPFRPETFVFKKIIEEGFKPPRDPNTSQYIGGYGESGCRCGYGYMQRKDRDATAEEIASYNAARVVHVPQWMIQAAQPTQHTHAWAKQAISALVGEPPQPFSSMATSMSEAMERLNKSVDSLSEKLEDTKKERASDRVRVAGLEMRLETLKYAQSVDALRSIDKTKTAKQQESRMETVVSEALTETEAPKLTVFASAKKTLVEDTSDSMWRVAAMSAVDTVRDALAAGKAMLPKQYKEYHAPLVKFINTPLGGAALSYAVGIAVLHLPIPGVGIGQRKRLAKELRVSGQTTGMYTMLRPVIGFVVSLVFGSLGSVFKGLPQMADEETETPKVRVDAKTDAKTDASPSPTELFNQILATEIAKNEAKTA